VNCNADEASVLVILSEHGSMSVTSLIQRTGFEGRRLKRSLQNWIERRIVDWDGAESLSMPEIFTAGPPVIDTCPDSWPSDIQPALSKITLEVSAELLRSLPLVCGALTNLGPMPLGSIQSHLRKISINYQSQESELHIFLESQVSSGTLHITAEGFYNVSRRM